MIGDGPTRSTFPDATKIFAANGPNRESRARFEPRNYGNVDRVGPSPNHPRLPASARSVRNIEQPLLCGGLRGALFVHIASFVIPRRAMPPKVMSRHMTRLGTVVEGRA